MVFKPKAWLFAQSIIYTNTFLSFNSGLLLFCGLVQYNNSKLCRTLGFINFLQYIEFAMHPAYFCQLDPNFLLAIMSNYFLLTDDEIISY
jgi:hypothetical protein